MRFPSCLEREKGGRKSLTREEIFPCICGRGDKGFFLFWGKTVIKTLYILFRPENTLSGETTVSEGGCRRTQFMSYLQESKTHVRTRHSGNVYIFPQQQDLRTKEKKSALFFFTFLLLSCFWGFALLRHRKNTGAH